MPELIVTPEEQRRAYDAMGLQVPFDSLSPLLLKTLAVVARCALARPASPLPAPRRVPDVDRKRLAAGDRD